MHLGVLGLADYVGPYFVSCDHGCSHGNKTHATVGCSNDWHGPHAFHGHGRYEARMFVMSESLRAIDSADLIFAYLNSPDCYGTLYELGYARARGIRIELVHNLSPEIADDMWFTMCASYAGRHTVDPIADLRRYLEGFVECIDTFNSEAERRFWREYRRMKPPELAGLVKQQEALGGKYQIDFALPLSKIGIEIDGYAYHSDRDTFTRDRKRQRELENAGWRIIRFSGKEACDDPARCVSDTATAVRVFTGGSRDD
jgi:very-short-patch-repair endonuclease